MHSVKKIMSLCIQMKNIYFFYIQVKMNDSMRSISMQNNVYSTNGKIDSTQNDISSAIYIHVYFILSPAICMIASLLCIFYFSFFFFYTGQDKFN